MKADPLKQRKITTMFQSKPINVQEQLFEKPALNDIEDFGENEDNNLVEVKPRPMVTKKRKRDISPIDARNWREALGPPPLASDIQVYIYKIFINYAIIILKCSICNQIYIF